jgi:hypothetical protein
MIDHADKNGWKPLYLIIRHLHPSAEFYDLELRFSHLFFYNNQDFNATSGVSKQFPHLKIFDGATLPNGYTYQVELLNGKQLL